MGTYGRNFDFRVTPEPRERQGRYVLDNGSDVPIGAPVIATGTADDELTGALGVELATGAQAPPDPGQGGIVVYEWIDLNGLDPVLNDYSDRGDAPDGRMVQVVRGQGVKVVFRNTSDSTFMANAYPAGRSYAGRIMVAGVGATPTVAVGDYLTPGTGDDDNGYWTETANANEAWLVIESVDPDRGEVEARLLF